MRPAENLAPSLECGLFFADPYWKRLQTQSPGFLMCDKSVAALKDSSERPGLRSEYVNLDLLRSIAVIAVVIWHLWDQSINSGVRPDVPAITQFMRMVGSTGVMFFFVHTCLVLMLSMHRSPRAHLARNFLIRRGFRIYPLCWATLCLVWFTRLTDMHGSSLHELGWWGVFANIALAQNFLTPRSPEVLGPLWSLPWEMQMYLVLPAFYLILSRFKAVLVVFAIWLVATGTAIATGGMWHPAMPHLPDYWSVLRGAGLAPMFISGMVAYRLLLWQAENRKTAPLPAAGWPVIVLTLLVLEPSLVTAQWLETPSHAATNALICLALGVSIPGFRALTSHWLTSASRHLARYSYGIYLLHVPAIILVFHYLNNLYWGLKIVLALVITGAGSVLAYHAIENPLIRLGKQLTRTRPVADQVGKLEYAD